MSTFLVSFRIANDAGYSNRWASTVAAIHREASGGTFWEETTSLVIIKSDKTADSLAASIYLASDFLISKDTLLVVNANTGAYSTRGKVDYPATLASLFAGNAFAGNALAQALFR